MFSFLKSKSAPLAQSIISDTLRRTAQVVQLQLLTCKRIPNYNNLLRHEFSRGCLIGYFDASLQLIEANLSDDTFADWLIPAHAVALDFDEDAARSYVAHSLSRMLGSQFAHAQCSAGKEYFRYIQGKIRRPRLLESFFHDHDGSKLQNA